MSLLDKIQSNSKIKDSATLAESKVFGKNEMISTDVPIINCALSGSFDGGISPGLLQLAGPSRHFKTMFSLVMLKAFLEKHPEGVAIFYDSEFGSPPSYFEGFGIDLNRVLHTPITNIEELKNDLSNQLNGLSRGDKVMIIVDSIGNLASIKEVDDALEGKQVADMSRAKAIKSVFRIVTPHLTLKHIPMIAVNHTYAELGLYPRQIASGGCVVEGTKILSSSGAKEIQDFQVGDIVKTLNGENTVTHVWNPCTLDKGQQLCYEVEFEDGTTAIVSEKHRFLVEDNWIEADQLEIGMDCKTL